MSTRASEKKTISKTLNRQIGLYSMAAAVAGVSMLALAEPAVGEVIVTKKSIPIAAGTEPAPVFVSLANNGVDNFSFKLYQNDPGRFLLVDGVDKDTDRARMGGFWDPYAQALPRNTKIGASATFFWYDGLVEMSASSGANKYCKGYWGTNLTNRYIGCGNPKNTYMGVEFTLNGETHYGWIRLNIKTTSNPTGPQLTATITGYAYETIAGKPIVAGTAATASSASARQPHAGPSLGMLAAGAEGMPMWRRELAASSK